MLILKYDDGGSGGDLLSINEVWVWCYIYCILY